MAEIDQLLDELEIAWQPGTSRRKRQASDVIHDLIVEAKKLPMKDGEN
jgi:hypothetical protein